MEHFLTLIFDPSNKFYQILLAVALGIFIGLRRERRDADGKIAADIMGIRTTALLVVLGVVATLFSDMPGVFAVILIGVLLFMVVAYINGVWRLKRYGLTAEISGLLMFLIGVCIGKEEVIVAILLAILLGVSSAYKASIRSFAHQFSLKEWSGTLQLLVITAIILPLLPKEAVDPFGVIVPFDIWMLVIFLATMGFVGYFITKHFGEKKSVLFVSFFGALASSTATTTALARRSRSHAARERLILAGILLAIAVMQLRVIIEILVLSGDNQIQFLMPSLVMMITAAIFSLISYITAKKDRDPAGQFQPDLKSPFEIVPALTFAGFFVLVLVAIYAGNHFFGEAGVYISAFIAAFADVDAVVFSSLLSYGDGHLSKEVVLQVIALVTVVNTIIKLVYIRLFGSKTLLRIGILPITIISLAGLFVGFLA